MVSWDKYFRNVVGFASPAERLGAQKVNEV